MDYNSNITYLARNICKGKQVKGIKSSDIDNTKERIEKEHYEYLDLERMLAISENIEDKLLNDISQTSDFSDFIFAALSLLVTMVLFILTNKELVKIPYLSSIILGVGGIIIAYIIKRFILTNNEMESDLLKNKCIQISISEMLDKMKDEK